MGFQHSGPVVIVPMSAIPQRYYCGAYNAGVGMPPWASYWNVLARGASFPPILPTGT